MGSGFSFRGRNILLIVLIASKVLRTAQLFPLPFRGGARREVNKLHKATPGAQVPSTSDY